MRLGITGMGVVSSLGTGKADFLQGLSRAAMDPDAAFGQSRVLSEENVGYAEAGEVWGFDAKDHLGKKGLRNFDRLTKFLIVAAKHALEDAGLKQEGAHVAYRPEEVGVCSSTAYGSLDAITELNLVAELEDPRYINPARFPNTVINAAAGYVSIWEDLRAPNVTIVDGNCGALDAVLTAHTHLHEKRARAFLVGGGEVLSDPLYLAFQKLGVISGQAKGERGDALRLGEGASYVVAEHEADIRARGAKQIAVISGYGTAFSPPTSEALIVHAASEPVQRAIALALAESGREPEEIDFVVSSSAGMEHVDGPELEGIAAALGKSTAVLAPKRFMGETFGAAGALGVAACLGWFAGAQMPRPVRGSFDASDKPCCAVIVTVGFYGNVSAIVLEAC